MRVAAKYGASGYAAGALAGTRYLNEDWRPLSADYRFDAHGANDGRTER